MDEELKKLLGDNVDEKSKQLHLVDEGGTVEVRTAEGDERYAMKGLRDLYGAGVNAASMVPDSPEYMPLFMGIEETIVQYWSLDRGLTDGQVTLVLDRMGLSPEAAAGEGDDLQVNLQLRLRLILSIHDYSRKDVQRALRTVSKSVARHMRDGGRQGYLAFIKSFLG